MIIKDEVIKYILESQLQYLYSIYNEKQILGIFTYGKVNYGFAEKESDIQTLFVYIPSYSELCSISPDFNIKTVETLPNGQKIKKVDIRGIYNFASEQDGVMMEVLFSEYQIINPRFKKAFKKHFLINKEIIFHCDPQARVKNVVKRAQEALQEYEKNQNNDFLFQACYLRIACRLYLDGVSCENCINLKKDYHTSYLWQILTGNIKPNLEEIKNDFSLFLEEVNEHKKNSQCIEDIKQGVQELIKIALTDTIQTESFKNKLTDLEQQALLVILNNLADGYEGVISVSQLVASSTISRPVFKNVLQKMKDNLIAEIENKGVKGTYIKIIDGNLLSE